ncbi:hypothetical protein QAD02_005021, partial [Eretmocerus hayati]
LRNLLQGLAKIRRSIVAECEEARFTRSADMALLMSHIYCGYLFLGWFSSLVLGPHVATILDQMAPIPNKTREKLILIHLDYYFFKQTDYHVATSFHFAIVLLLSFIMIAGWDCFFVTATSHVCSVFAITSARLEKVGHLLCEEMQSLTSREKFFHSIIDIHCRSI